MNLGVRLLFFAIGFFLATTGPTLLTREEPGAYIFLYGNPARYVEVLNGYYTFYGTLMTIAGLILIITAFYRREEKFPIIKTWFETECW